MYLNSKKSYGTQPPYNQTNLKLEKINVEQFRIEYFILQLPNYKHPNRVYRDQCFEKNNFTFH